MKHLIECVDIVDNNDNCVVLKVKDNQKDNLICIGCFDGDEDMFRITKGKHISYTIFKKNGSYATYDAYQVVPNNISKIMIEIYDCIVKDFGIMVDTNTADRSKYNFIRKPNDYKKIPHLIAAMWWKNNPEKMIVNIDGFFAFNCSNSYLKEYIAKYDIAQQKEYIATTGCFVKEFYTKCS